LSVSRSTCKEGLWSCTDYVCSATAAAFGHYHFVTFDGEFFTEAADCPYILSEDEAGTFRIYVTNVREVSVLRFVVCTWTMYLLER